MHTTQGADHDAAQQIDILPAAAADTQRAAATLARAFSVDPHVVGGIRVQVGDDVVDGSMASRLNDLQRRMAG